jgi:hypothetical protein
MASGAGSSGVLSSKALIDHYRSKKQRALQVATEVFRDFRCFSEACILYLRPALGNTVVQLYLCLVA